MNTLWKALKRAGELSLARAVLERVRDGEGLLDGLPKSRKNKERLCQQEALLISKDPEINSAVRHDLAIETLGEEFDLDDRGWTVMPRPSVSPGGQVPSSDAGRSSGSCGT
ncbi:MAG: hypothetical protein U5J82_00570 [Desulfobacterales bacterium]|nr:hypothetical protein [Desulfobacterales bacterium]